MSAYSTAVLAAQARLIKKRAHFNRTFPLNGRVLAAVSSAKAAFPIPDHLGWGSQPLSVHLQKRTPAPLTSPKNPVSQPTTVQTSAKSSRSAHCRHYPSLGVAAIEQQRVPHYLVWLACRWLDQQGSGWLELPYIRAKLADSQSNLHLFGWRRLRQVLGQGHGHLWAWDKRNKRLWLFSAAKIGRSLQCPKVVGQPILLPLTALTKGIGTFKAHLYAAWHSGRQSNHPISRQTLQQITHVPERTQRHYERLTRTKTRANLAIGAAYTPENIEQIGWQRGGALFKFLDKNGRFGSPNQTYLAWQLPNSYVGPHQQAARGQQRRINHQLTDLVHQGAQGNGKPAIGRCFFDHGSEAVTAVLQDKTITSYWKEGRVSHYDLWHIFF